jgi:hypothetical protein
MRAVMPNWVRCESGSYRADEARDAKRSNCLLIWRVVAEIFTPSNRRVTPSVATWRSS